MSKHTLGPWRTGGEHGFHIHETTGQQNCLAIANMHDTSKPNEEIVANARLIAASPELLIAAQSAFKLLEWVAVNRDALGKGGMHPRDSDAWLYLSIAIEKATGKQVEIHED